MKPSFVPVAAAALLLFAACATESHRVVDTDSVASYRTDYSGPVTGLVVGMFQNSSPYMRGMFSTGEDRLGNQAKTILQTHLTQTGRFALMDRSNLEALQREAAFGDAEPEVRGANYIVTGQVTEFGRRATGDRQLFGILGRGKEQTAYAVVSLNIVDVRTSEVVHAVQGGGEYALSAREVVGFGGTASYDSTLNGKVLNLAIMNAVDKLVHGIEAGEWQPVGG